MAEYRKNEARDMGTSNYEYFGPMIPKIFAMIQDSHFDKAMELYWQMHPARQGNMQAMAMFAGLTFSTACCGSIKAGSNVVPH